MPVNYDAIRAENLRKYGTDITRIGPMLLADRYADRTHFIYEILQNTEDALKKRSEWGGQRTIKFALNSKGLTISHHGKPFDEKDVQGVCGIGESSKKLTDIGRFGIGFKSVYAFTDKPEIHSGEEHFAIDSYVWPRSVEAESLLHGETQICIPFRDSEPSTKEDVLEGLKRLGPSTLLFLQEIKEIVWSVDDTPAGHYIRSSVDTAVNGARKVQIAGQDGIYEDWLVFSREVFNEGESVGYVEVAFALNTDLTDGKIASVKSVTDFPLVAFFPTVLPTRLGFLVQGPYRTTPSRDNVPENDVWNRHLVRETAILLVEALKGLRELGLLSVSAIECLPLSASWFCSGSRFALLFQEAKKVLLTEPLLPAYGGGYISGQNAKLAGSRELRELISPQQLADLFPDDDAPAWLSDEITPNLTPDLYRYLNAELDVGDVNSEGFIRRLSPEFLEAQPDEWIERLYTFLNGQRGQEIRRLITTIPLVRLEDGSHTVAYKDEKPQAYLPGVSPTGFPTVRRSVCQSSSALAFLEALNLRLPDPVDDVIAHILPKYRKDTVDVPDLEYRSDIEQILTAFATDSNAQRGNLLTHLREAKFIVAVDTFSRVSKFVRPWDAYAATDRLKDLFDGVPGVLMVDDSRRYFRGEQIRNLIRAVGISEHLVPIPVEPALTTEDERELATRLGRMPSVKDYTLRGLDALLTVIASLPIDQASNRAKLLWQALRDVQQHGGRSAFYGQYSWRYRGERSEEFSARSVKALNNAAWVPDKDGTLQTPGYVVFQDTGWEQDPALEAKILFKPAIIDQLAKEAGIEPGLLDLVRKRGISEAKLRELLGDDDESDSIVTDIEEPKTVPTILPVGIPDNAVSPRPAGTNGVSQTQTTTSPGGSTARQPSAPREFISYVKTSPDDSDKNTEGLSHEQRMDLEEQAIKFIRSKEPALQRTPPNNAGFDLQEMGPDGNPVRWVEVKAMSGTFDNRPATLSKTQFEFAQRKGNSCWLYVVENAGNPTQSRLIRIKDPAGKAQTFTFDKGWLEVAE